MPSGPLPSGMTPLHRATGSLIVLLLIACGGGASPTPTPTAAPAPEVVPEPVPVTVRGTISHNDQTMKVIGAVAVHDAAARALRITFLPFEPTPEEVVLFKENNGSLVILKRDEGTIEGFPDRIPRTELTLRWDEGESIEQARYHMFFNRLTTPYSSMNLNWRSGSEHTVTIEGELGESTPLTLATSGRDTVFDESVSWELTFRGPAEVALSAID